MKRRIELSSNYISESDLNTFSNTLKNQKFPFESNIQSFESILETYLEENTKVTALSSGTAAIHLALILLGIKKEDDVLCSTFTFNASANPIRYVCANPIFIDSELDTWNMSPVYLRNAIEDKLKKGKKPKAIIVVDSYGMPSKWNEIINISEEYNIPIIEDAAEALGSSFQGKKCGTFGEMSIISFNNNKIITTTGGGALVCKDGNQKKKAVFFATQAKEQKDFYEHKKTGYNYRMSPILAAIGNTQITQLDNKVKARESNHIFYNNIFKDIKGTTLLSEFSSSFISNHWLNCVLIDSKITGWTNKDLREAFLIENIESRFLWKPLHTQPVFKNCEYYGSQESQMLFQNGLALPSGSNLTEADKDRIQRVIKSMN